MSEKSELKRFILIDGNAIIHRAFHALPPLTYNGKILNAAYGFFSMFFKILEDLQPAYIAVCFDRPKPTFRKQLFVGYQAKRPGMSDDLVPQIGVIHDVLEKSGISMYELDGYEADDLIGTIAFQLVHSSQFTVHGPKEIEVIIVSGDRDLLQLVNSHVKMLAPVTGITNMILYDERKVEEKFGIKPVQFIDYKALIGDNSDNYPGVSGIGPKTAVGLLKQYETFENLYQSLPSLPPKIAEKLAVDAEQAAMAKKLATIVTDAPIHIDLKACDIHMFDTKKATDALSALGFKSILKRIPKIEKKKEKKEKSKDEQLGFL